MVGSDIMNVRLGTTRHSIMFGDNLRMAASCEYLSEMLCAVGRPDEAAEVLAFGQDLRHRIEALAWNGSFFTHQTPEDPSVTRDFGGTDESSQVVLSNTYALNANISHEKCVAILRTYLLLRISPRWSASEEKDVSITAKYEASGGYVAYRFEKRDGVIRLVLTGNASTFALEILLPEGQQASGLRVNGITHPLETKTVEQSEYVLASISGVGVHTVDVLFRPLGILQAPLLDINP